MPDYPAGLSRRPADDAPAFGDRIRAMRKAAGLTLERLSDASGISRAALSRIERGEMSPTYESLLKLARGLRTDLAALVSGRRPAGGGCEVTRGGDGAVHRDPRFTHRLLAPDLPDRGLFAFVTEVRASDLSQYDEWDCHDSEDFLYVLDGAVAVHLAGRDPVELRAGDAMQMDGRIAHALVALPEAAAASGTAPTAQLLWVSLPFE